MSEGFDFSSREVLTSAVTIKNKQPTVYGGLFIF